MLLSDPKVPFRYEPAGEHGPVYLLKVPTVSDRVNYRHALRAAGAVRWSELQMLSALADGIREVLCDSRDAEQRDLLLTDIEAFRERISGFATALQDGEVDRGDPVAVMKLYAAAMEAPPRLKAAETIIEEHVPRYAKMVADREVFAEFSGLIAARMFLLGWENVPQPGSDDAAPFRRSAVGVPDEILSVLPAGHLEAIGAQVAVLLEPPEARLGNSRSESGQRSGRTPSNGTGTRPATSRSKTIGGTAKSSVSEGSGSTR